jgi:hypothetical protein
VYCRGLGWEEVYCRELGPGTDLGFYITPPSALSVVKALLCWVVWLAGWLQASLGPAAKMLRRLGGPWC